MRYPIILFDWGDTVMIDSNPISALPMASLPNLEIVPGVDSVLEVLHASQRKIILTTNAAISTEEQISEALARVGLDKYFERIFCFKNTYLLKGEDFYRYILKDLDIDPSQVLMIGDNFEKDVLAPSSVGIQAIWFNPLGTENRHGNLHFTIHNMQQLLSFFNKFDAK
jgi:putative hydrolase of the HAD superfamily